MAVSDEVLAQAAGGREEALEELLCEHLPTIRRMALAISGRADVAREVQRRIVGRAGRMLATWRDAAAAERWFHHQATLLLRQRHDSPPRPAEDALVLADGGASAGPAGGAGGAGAGDLGYMAFVRALRHLPPQQQEAFVLRRGEGWDLRRIAVSMDCSTRAVETHLHAAESALREVAGGDFGSLAGRLASAYAALAGAPRDMLEQVRGEVQRILRPRRMWRWVKVAALLAALAGAVYLARKFRLF